MKNPPKEKQVLPRLKAWLLQGKKITHNQALSMWKTNRLAEYIRRLRESGLTIYTEMKQDKGDVYGVYSINKPKKVFHS